MHTPKQIEEHSERFHHDAWRGYTVGELAMWVHLLRRRADMRTEPEKAQKDRVDADNYEAMLREMMSG